MSNILFFEGCNFFDHPLGGQLNFAKQMIKQFGTQLYLVGWAIQNEPVGKWIKRDINGKEIDVFNIAKRKKTYKKPLIPDRIITYLGIKKYQKKIFEKKCINVFTRAPEIVLAIKNINRLNLCYYFPGIENPLIKSRYIFARSFANIYEKVFLKKLKSANCMLAAADYLSINEAIDRSNGNLQKNSIIQFPTRVDTNLFKDYNNKINIRKELNLPAKKQVIITSGRLAWYKGWKFMIDSYQNFIKINNDSIMYFIGGGEDKIKIENYIKNSGLTDSIILLGYKKHDKLVKYLNASDLFIMGSEKEGWCTTLVEALACNIPVCVTNFSSAKDMINQGKNGFVVDQRDEHIFTEYMLKAINLSIDNSSLISTYALNNLKKDILNLWQLKKPYNYSE